MIELAKSEEGIAIGPEALDPYPDLITCPNGVIDLSSGALLPHERSDMSTRLCPTHYVPGATCPAWDAFLGQIMAGDASMVAFLRAAIGYSIAGRPSREILFLAHGLGANGKSTFLRTLATVLGNDHACTLSADVLMAHGSGFGEHPTAIATLHGKRLAVAIETEAEKTLAEGLIKSITGGDKIRTRRMREDYWEFDPRHVIWLASNHRPNVRGADLGIWRRILLIPFEVTIPEAQRDLGLRERLESTEAAGILAWAVRGALDVWAVPPHVDGAQAGYREEQDRLREFLADCIRRVEGATVPAIAVWQLYRVWCGERDDKPMRRQTFIKALEERGYKTEHARDGDIMRNISAVGALAAVVGARFRLRAVPDNTK
jgi:putative DNA primase/helicase